MAPKFYAFFYVIYAWSERVFFLLLAALLVIPFMTFDSRWHTWLLVVFAALSLPLVAKLAERICRVLLATQAKKASPPFPAPVDDEFEEQRLAAIARRQAAIDAEARHAAGAAEQQRRLETAWWINRNRL
jgi:hypothetical protein